MLDASLNIEMETVTIIMRIFYGSFLQETNTFCPMLSNKTTFERGYYVEGDAIAEHLRDTNTEIAGFLDYFSDKDVTLLPGIACWAVASGKVAKDTYENIVGQLCEKLKAVQPVDGVFLALHGAMVAEHIDDCEGDTISRIRTIVGENIPIVISLDYHANITEKMVQLADVMVGFRTYPHIDFEETGYKAAKVLDVLLHEDSRPIPIFAKLPLIVPVEDSESGKGISGNVIKELEKLDNDPELVSESFFCAQPWLDIEYAGVSLLFYVKANTKDIGKWRSTIARLAEYVFDNREAFFGDYPSFKETVENIDNYRKPVIFVDSGDVTTAGGIGDSTEALRALLNANVNSALSIISAKAVARAFELGAGNKGRIVIGGEIDFGYNRDVEVEAEVISLSDTHSKVTGESFSGVEVDTGRRAYLVVGGHLHIVVAEYASMMCDPQLLRDMGLHPEKMDVIVQKSHKLFRAAYANIAKQVVILDTPGFTDKNLKRLPFTRVPRPIYPLDEDTSYHFHC